METNVDGTVRLHSMQKSPDNINTASDNFKNQRFAGRGVIAP